MNAQVLAAIVAVLGVVASFVRPYITAKFGAQKLATVHQLSSIAINAAERAATSAGLTTGAAKFTYASQYLVDAAKHIGVKLTTAEVTGFIHSALADYEHAKGIISPTS